MASTSHKDEKQNEKCYNEPLNTLSLLCVGSTSSKWINRVVTVSVDVGISWTACVSCNSVYHTLYKLSYYGTIPSPHHLLRSVKVLWSAFVFMDWISRCSKLSWIPFSKSMLSRCASNTFLSRACLVAPSCSLKASQHGCVKMALQLKWSSYAEWGLVNCSRQMEMSPPPKPRFGMFSCWHVILSFGEFWITVWLIVLIFHRASRAESCTQCWVHKFFRLLKIQLLTKTNHTA